MFGFGKKDPATTPVEKPAAPAAPERHSIDWFAQHARPDSSGRFDHAYDWTSKDEYLAWVKGWQGAYAAMTHDARHPTKKQAISFRWNALTKSHDQVPLDQYYDVTKWCRQDRYYMMVVRMEGKKLSWQQRCARVAQEQQR